MRVPCKGSTSLARQNKTITCALLVYRVIDDGYYSGLWLNCKALHSWMASFNLAVAQLKLALDQMLLLKKCLN